MSDRSDTGEEEDEQPPAQQLLRAMEVEAGPAGPLIEAHADRGSLPESCLTPSHIDLTVDAAVDRLDSDSDDDDDDDDDDIEDEEMNGGIMHNLLEGAKSLIWKK